MSTRTSMQLRNLYSICPCKLLCCCYKRSSSPWRPPSSASAAWSTPLVEQRQDSGIDLSLPVSLSQNSQEISIHLEVLHECLVIMLGVSRSRSRAQYNNSGPLALMLSLALLLSLVAFVLPAVISASASDLPAAATQNDEEPTVTRKLLQSANSETTNTATDTAAAAVDGKKRPGMGIEGRYRGAHHHGSYGRAGPRFHRVDEETTMTEVPESEELYQNGGYGGGYGGGRGGYGGGRGGYGGGRGGYGGGRGGYGGGRGGYGGGGYGGRYGVEAGDVDEAADSTDVDTEELQYRGGGGGGGGYGGGGRGGGGYGGGGYGGGGRGGYGGRGGRGGYGRGY